MSAHGCEASGTFADAIEAEGGLALMHVHARVEADAPSPVSE